MPLDEMDIPFNIKTQAVASPKKSKNAGGGSTQTIKAVPSSSSNPVVNEAPAHQLAMPSSETHNHLGGELKEGQPSPPPLEDARTPRVESDHEDDDEPSLPPPLTPAPPICEENLTPADSTSQTISQSGLPILDCSSRSNSSPDCVVSSAVDDGAAVVHSTQEDTSKPLNISIEDTKEDDCSVHIFHSSFLFIWDTKSLFVSFIVLLF